jgi:hypothetical protein
MSVTCRAPEMKNPNFPEFALRLSDWPLDVNDPL